MKQINRILKLMIFLLFLFCLQQSLFADGLQTAKKLYEEGKKNYDISTLEEALNKLEKIPKEKEYEYLLQKGLILQRIQFIYYVKEDENKVKKFGEQVIEVLSKAIEKKPNSLSPIAYRGMSYQMLATLGWRSGAKYGPKSGEALEAIKQLNHEHILTRFMDAVAYLESPKFFGGDTKKALEEFVSLNKDYPKDEDVKVHLAKAYFKEEKYKKAFEILKEILENNPQNLLAKKFLTEVQKELK